VGKVNEGWPIAKKLLGFERTMIADVYLGAATPPARALIDLARRYVGPAEGHQRPAATRPHHS
jgi:alkylation response protein AidB-like acyl-CoA dehydrogenase